MKYGRAISVFLSFFLSLLLYMCARLKLRRICRSKWLQQLTIAVPRRFICTYIYSFTHTYLTYIHIYICIYIYIYIYIYILCIFYISTCLSDSLVHWCHINTREFIRVSLFFRHIKHFYVHAYLFQRYKWIVHVF